MSENQNYLEASKGQCHSNPIRYYGRTKLGVRRFRDKVQTLFLCLNCFFPILKTDFYVHLKMAAIGSVFHFTWKLEADSIYWNKIIHQYHTTLCLELEKSIRIFHKAFLLTPMAGIKPRPPEQQASALSLLHGADKSGCIFIGNKNPFAYTT